MILLAPRLVTGGFLRLGNIRLQFPQRVPLPGRTVQFDTQAHDNRATSPSLAPQQAHGQNRREGQQAQQQL